MEPRSGQLARDGWHESTSTVTKLEEIVPREDTALKQV
jgi:hypothetical protein